MHFGDLQSLVEISVELGALDDVRTEFAVEHWVRWVLRALRPEVVETSLKREAGNVVERDAAGFDRTSVVNGGKAHGAVDQHDSPGVLEQEGQALVVDVEDTSLEVQVRGQLLEQERVVVVPAIERMMLKDNGGCVLGVLRKGFKDFGDEAVLGSVIGVNNDLGIRGHLERDKEVGS